MDNGHFYFINDQYFIDFPDPYLMQNKEVINGQEHNRPCFYAFEDSNNKGLYWMIPFSSQTNKFHKIYSNKIAKYGKCDTIVFGKVLGHEKAFLKDSSQASWHSIGHRQSPKYDIFQRIPQ